MTPKTIRKSLLCLSLAMALSQPVIAQSTDTFIASHIRVDGQPRISDGKLFT